MKFVHMGEFAWYFWNPWKESTTLIRLKRRSILPLIGAKIPTNFASTTELIPAPANTQILIGEPDVPPGA
jgi:hypothetical protein